LQLDDTLIIYIETDAHRNRDRRADDHSGVVRLDRQR
jgi:hypothetical protein